MIHAAAPALTAEQLADLLLTPDVNELAMVAELAVELGARPARRLLAAAHGIAADRLWNAA
ncbi:hypothetical protein G6W57_00880 [Streptomyces sp. CAI-121]|uniref:hypothetical protein n=1 Tax=unclassified Streptomyces TaxID=2593676 RepID=UPI0015874CBF|nr:MULTISPECIES: hypothetical protein [unclassified Streptomyces]NUV65669.1 hypothetical protein [Streptomyces sp. CAI-121]NUW12406.1 hypothetical protein [Streptomyces sp. CAI-68]